MAKVRRVRPVVDTSSLPFWEQQRGDGPLTRALEQRATLRERFAKDEAEWLTETILENAAGVRSSVALQQAKEITGEVKRKQSVFPQRRSKGGK